MSSLLRKSGVLWEGKLTAEMLLRVKVPPCLCCGGTQEPCRESRFEGGGLEVSAELGLGLQPESGSPDPPFSLPKETVGRLCVCVFVLGVLVIPAN